MSIISALLPLLAYILRVLLTLSLFLNLHLLSTPLIFIVQLLNQLSLPALPPTSVPHPHLAIPLLVLLPLLVLSILVVQPLTRDPAIVPLLLQPVQPVPATPLPTIIIHVLIVILEHHPPILSPNDQPA